MEILLIVLLVVALGVIFFLWKRGALKVDKEKMQNVTDRVREEVDKIRK